MNPTSDHQPATARGRDPRWVRVLGGGLFGLAFGYGGAMLVGHFLPDFAAPDDFGAAQLGALILAAMALAMALIIFAMAFSKRLYESENWTRESDPDEHRHIAPSLRLTGIAMLAMAIELGAFALPPSPVYALPVIATILAALVVQLWTSWLIWRESDELQRTAMVEGSALSLAILLVLITLWAPFALYGFVGFDPVAMILLLTIGSTVPTIWISVKRGLTK